MARLQPVRSLILRYGLAAACVATALGVGLAFQHLGFRHAESPLFDLAVVCSAWLAGAGPSAVAVVLSAMCLAYYFIPPLYSFEVTSEEMVYFILFSLWAALIASFLSARRRIESELRRARDHLELEVQRSRHRENEIVRLNEELERRAQELQTSNRELESFAYSVSHDLRAPIRHVVGFSELLQKHAAMSLNDKGQRYVMMILESATRMGDLIDDLLAFSRIGRAETRRTVVDLDLLVREVVAEMKQDTSGRAINWKIHDLPICHGDRSMLKQVIVNLVSNSIKFTRDRPQAEIEIGSTDVDQRRVEVFVKDNGAGFDMQYAHKLFGVFQRLHLPEQFEGTGIGLAIVQRIIVRHGGAVRAEGVVDGGATFYFTLPKMEVATAPTAEIT